MSRVFRVVLLAGLEILVLVSCRGADIPAVESFTVQAKGTLLPAEAASHPVSLPMGVSGVAMFNNSPATVRVVVSDTVTGISPEEGFLFILPPQEYQFYIYYINGPSQVHVERVEQGKVRYVYLMAPSVP